MLRRRLFSAAMASVMALSTVAVVAQAEETTQVVTKDQLKQQIEVVYGSKYRANDLEKFSRSTAKAMLDALEAADAILADADSDADDWTVAYMMVEACHGRLRTVSNDDLKELVKKAEVIINKGNVNSEVLMDLIYSDDKFLDLDNQLSIAKDYVDSTSGADVTEAYDNLKAAYDACAKLPSVKKSEFRSILREYEAIIADEFLYNSWMRGTVADVADSDGSTKAFINKGEGATFGALYDYCVASKEYINTAYDRFDDAKGITETTDDAVIAGYKLAGDLVKLYDSWTADSAVNATKAGLKNLMKKYHGQLVHDYETTAIENLVGAIKAKSGDVAAYDDANWTTESVEIKTVADAAYNRLTKAQYNVKPTTNAVCIEIGEDGYVTDAANPVVVLPEDRDPNARYVTIAKGSSYDISKLIKVEATNIDEFDFSNNTYVDDTDEISNVNPNAVAPATEEYGKQLADIYALAEAYLAGDHVAVTADFKALEDTNKILKDTEDAKGSAKELAVIYRALEYALDDLYAGKATAAKLYKKADVKALIDKAYDLVDLTGDAAIFNAANVALVEARQAALDWYATTSRKDYKDDGNESDPKYKALKDVYDALEKEYNALKYSFGDVYNKLAETAKAIDAGKLVATDELLAAMDATAYCLSVIPADTILDDGVTPYEYNYAFDDSRIFEGENRVVTKISCTESVEIAEIGDGVRACEDHLNKEHAKLAAAYEDLLKLIEKQTSAPAVLGDANGDGALTAADASAILKASVGLAEIDQKAADHNGDGSVTAADAASILKAIVA